MEKAREERAVLRQLLRLLLAERGDADGLVYLPAGVQGMRRMTERLLLLRPDAAREDEVSALVQKLEELGCPLENTGE